MKKKQLNNSFWEGTSGTIAVAHRGGDAAGIEKENSMSAFEAAYKIGYRWFETDVVATKDRQLLAVHGRGYQRSPNKDLPFRTYIRYSTYETISREVRVGGEKPLLLTDLLDTFKDIKLFIDPKTYRTGLILARTLSAREKDLDRVLVGSFLPFNTARVRRAIKKSTNYDSGTSIIGPLRSLPVKLAGFKPVKPLAVLYISFNGAKSVHVPYRWVTGASGDRFISTARELGLKVVVYTPNDGDSIRVCASRRVDAIMSDKLRLLNEIISTTPP